MFVNVSVIIRSLKNIILHFHFLYILHSTGVVSWLSVSSKSSNSLLLTWERPEYFTASLRGLLYYESLQQQAGSEGRWLYVDSSDRLQPITGLEESTNYSISMAVLDGNDRLCVFNEPLMVQTGNCS